MKKIDHATATEDLEFTEGNPGTGTPATRVTAQWLNVIQAELIKLVEMASIVPDQTGADKAQVAKALAVHVAGLDFYSDTGAADAYVFSPIGATTALNTSPPAYFDGLRVRVFPANNNTGACVAKIAGLDDKNIKFGAGAGSNPAAASIMAGIPLELVFDGVNDCWKFANYPGASAAFEGQLLHLQHRQASGTDGPAASGSGFDKLVLNTVLTNEIAGASLASSVITLPAGTYFAMGRQPFVERSTTEALNQIKLRNTDDSTDLLIGASNVFFYDGHGTNNFITGRFTIAAEKDIEFQGRSNTADKWGEAVNFGLTEIYGDLMIWKVA